MAAHEERSHAGPSRQPERTQVGEAFESLDDLRARVDRARSQRASLQAEIERLRSVPTAEQVQAAALASKHPLPPAVVKLSEQVAKAEDLCILHRTSGWTVFEIDLDLGRRERQQRRAEAALHLGKSSLGLGVRLDTFWRGRFYEPYYLVFAKKSQLLKSEVSVVGAALDVGREEALRHRLDEDHDDETKSQHVEFVRLIRHTIPHFVPLQYLVKQFLGRNGRVGAHERGGLELLDGLMDRQGLFDFLAHLHTHLQAFLSRREQAIALRSIRLPAYAKQIEAFGNDSFDHISVHWIVPHISPSDLEAYEQSVGIDRSSLQQDVAAARLRGRLDREERQRRKRKKQGIELLKWIKIFVYVNDLRTDRPGPLLETQTADFRRSDEGLACLDGSVKVEEFEDVIKRKKSKKDSNVATATPAAMKSIKRQPERVEVRRKRRADLERILVEQGGDLDQGVARVIKLVWQKELEARSKFELAFLARRSTAGTVSDRTRLQELTEMDEDESE